MKPILRLFLLLSLITMACGLGTATPPTIPSPTTAPATVQAVTAYMTFVVNIHDWMHPDESADILLQLIDLFERYNARGDFYFTAEITRELAYAPAWQKTRHRRTRPAPLTCTATNTVRRKCRGQTAAIADELRALAEKAGLKDVTVYHRPGKENGFMQWLIARKPAQAL